MHHVATADQMFDLGKRIGAQVNPGDLIVLSGPFGAGKTLLAQGIGAALGVDEITSPTFVISRRHKGVTPIVHVDLYRLLDSKDVLAAIADLDLESDSEKVVTIIEWAAAEYFQMFPERLEITIDRTSDVRAVSINGVGPRWESFSL
jgi:tRNA threonylcarbamoyladenosine biosynthesis protein TsaE